MNAKKIGLTLIIKIDKNWRRVPILRGGFYAEWTGY